MVAPFDDVAAMLAVPPAGYELVVHGWARQWAKHGRGVPNHQLTMALQAFMRLALGVPAASLRSIAVANAAVAVREQSAAASVRILASCERNLAGCERRVADLERGIADPERTAVLLDTANANLLRAQGSLLRAQENQFRAQANLDQATDAANLAQAVEQVDRLLQEAADQGYCVA
ncbi:hypothetical protein H4R19_004537 [Coemansia spiralis]|nr:hypothetical protein H4R19_004537 [Coemansia spiralis]